MYIKTVIIEGFKSYGTRTEIKGFDPEFNAITGLNGTGKSNILDSICFVLGISNLTHVRANNIVDLIYKCGQAGITKASVSVIFDNSDTSKSPINYEKYKEITVTRQIVVGGKNRFMINGSLVTFGHIQDFFSSVQLNVNNPHFLIMQGRITKVLSMKPPEILSMIEEAAGTKMYEHKKQAAQKTVQKKDFKLKEMDEMFNEQINPKMEKLKTERSNHTEFQRVQREIESLSRISVAYYFMNSELTLEREIKNLENLKEETENLKLKKIENEKEIEEIANQVKEMRKKLTDEEGSELEKLEKKLREKESVEAKALGQLRSMEEDVESGSRRKKQLEKNLREDEKALGVKAQGMERAEAEFGSLREAQQRDAEALVAAESKFEAVNLGLVSGDDGQEATIQDQLMMAKEQVSVSETEIKQCTITIDHSKAELKKKEAELRTTEDSFSAGSKDLEKKERELAAMQAHLKKSNYTEGMTENLQNNLRNLNMDIKKYSDIASNIKRRHPQLTFNYRDPEPNFDRRKVRGLICSLFTVNDPKFCRALEAAAGGKLYNVVVDNESVSSKLIKNGHLANRTTFAPINKISGYKMPNDVYKRAQQKVGTGNVFCAQSLITYSPEYESVMSWVFGQILICTTSEAASRICEDNSIKKKAVTLEGDVFDFAGVISGGAVVKSDPILSVIMELRNAEDNIKTKQLDQGKVSKQLSEVEELSATANNYKFLKTEIEMIQSRMQHTSHYKLKQEVAELKKVIEEKSNRIMECKKAVADKKKKVAELEYKVKNRKEIMEKELKAAEAALKKIQKQAEESKNNWKKREEAYETLKLEIEELRKAVEKCRDDITKAEESTVEKKNALAEFKTQLVTIKAEVKESQEKLKAMEEEIGKKNRDIDQLDKKKDALEKNINELAVTSASNEINRTKVEEEISRLKQLIKDLHRKNSWIETDKQYFGQPNGLYDFEKTDPHEATAKLKKLTELKEKLGKSGQYSKALDVLENQEEQLQVVLNRKGIVESDRNTIMSVIEELDVKKQSVIRTAWEQVNYDFDSILNSLLPGAHAKLVPPDGKDFTQGLQIKVGLGDIWKESLDELSGGQRSLVALSLILAMLLFKPAPLYILDEVDAALDQSHTQNIGVMLKKHFTQSQFLVVSLKDGMFSNANVIFRTSFVDGMSTVIRTVNKT